MGTDPILGSVPIFANFGQRKAGGGRSLSMPRAARVIVPDVAVHVTQRGNNRGACFFAEADYAVYLRALALFAPKCGCEVHAYCLMTNHVHILLTPRTAQACGELMKHVGQRYVQHVNRARGRTGTLWEGRFRSSIAASERYVLACYRYIELNPVRAGMVSDPAEYRWSSHPANLAGAADPLLTPHQAYLGLSVGAESRRRQYRGLFASALEPEVLEEIRRAARNGGTLRAPSKDRGRPKQNGDRPLK
jgi:REP-associated tyrosine transposase